MELPQFPREKECQACPLHESATNVCIPVTPLQVEGESKTAILVLGEKPSIEEDRLDRHHVGPVGIITTSVYLKYITDRVKRPVHFYGTNAVRCKPPQGADVTETQAKKCQWHLHNELAVLKAHYEEVIVLSCGGPATKQLTGGSLGKGYRKQGHLIEVGGFEVRFFCTLNPGILLPGRDPSAITSIEDHLLYVVDFLNHGKIPMEVDLQKRKWDAPNEVFPKPFDRIVSLDIETYGCLEEYPDQTVFHPQKSMEVDGIAREDLVVTAAATWDGPLGEKFHGLWVFPRDLQAFIEFVADIVFKGYTILGMNIPFDILYLRAWSPRLNFILSRYHDCRLMDLAISNFLESDTRPERSLKTIAPLLRVVEYDDEMSLGSGFKYSDRDDPELHHYNVLDTVATLECHKKLVERACRKRPGTGKFSEWGLKWYNDTLWTVIEMDEAGVKFDRDALQKVQDDALARMAKLWNFVWCTWGYPLEGKGSKAFPTMIVNKGVEEAGLVGDKRVARTKKTHEISTERDNLHLLLGALPIGSETRLQIEMLEAFRKDHKLVTSYTHKLLNIPQKGLVGDFAYPTWFSVPSSEKDGAGQMGGTQQGRLTCQGPGLQTSPAAIRKCMISRHTGGALLGADYSQIELRVPALFSGDMMMVQEYLDGVDRHEAMAVLIFGPEAIGNPKLRQVGKTLNFLMLFQGGARKFQETVRKDHGLELPLYVCKNAISAFRERYPVMIQWQEGLIEEAKTKGYLGVPLTGETRTFLGSRASVEETYIPKIVNFPVQTTAANIMKGAQRAISDRLRMEGLVSLCQENVYDAVYVDCPGGEVPQVISIFQEILPCPPFYKELQSHIGRTLPLGYEVKDIVTGEVLLKVK